MKFFLFDFLWFLSKPKLSTARAAFTIYYCILAYFHSRSRDLWTNIVCPFRITYVYRSIFNIHFLSVYLPRLFSIVSGSSLVLVTSVSNFRLLSFFSLSLSRFPQIWRNFDARSVSLFHRDFQSILLIQILPHPFSVHLFASSQSILISFKERASSRVRCFIKWLSNNKLEHQFEADKYFLMILDRYMWNIQK